MNVPPMDLPPDAHDSNDPNHSNLNLDLNSNTKTESAPHALDPDNITVDRIIGGIFAVVVFMGSLIGVGVLWLGAAPMPWPVVATVGAIVVNLILFWAAIFWPTIEHRHTSWQSSDIGMEIRRGVFWKHRIAIPWARVQHADVSQGPLQRMFDLGSLTIHTAGTKNASVTLDGLHHDVAVQLRDEVIRQRKAGDVV